ncbi:HTH-type transcriptional activator RhaR [Planctomycetes bacterium MalM25]|nr:HTH-type transcriptional activator RhaR [Planctomycetes bacterium MalM25]
MSSSQTTRRALPERLPDWGVAVLESHHAPDFHMEWRRHRFLKVVYVLSGAGQLWLDDRDIAYQAGDLLVVPAGTRNRLEDTPGEPASVYVLCLSRRHLACDPHAESRLSAGRWPRSVSLAKRAERRLRRLLYQQARGGVDAPIGMVAEALGLVAMLLTPEPRDGSPEADARAEVRRYVRELDGRFFEATTLDAAAAQLGLSRRRFTQLFREEAGETWLDAVRRRAIEHATWLLGESELSITAVAFECGFQDLSTFYRRFKSVHGCAPAAWRRRQRGSR